MRYTLITLILLVCAAASSICGQDLQSWTCNPPACQNQISGVNTGSLSISISGWCTNGNAPYGSSGVTAFNCLYLVTLRVWAYPVITSGMDAVSSNADARFFFSGTEYWFMWDDQWCDYWRNTYISPPQPC